MSRQGKLLIAHPNLPRNNPFSKSVIYVFNDNSHGTQGIILNKPADLSVHEFLLTKRFDGFPETSSKMRFGGPLSTKTVYMIHTDDFESTSSDIAGKGLMLSSDDFMFEKMSYGQRPSAWRVTVGVCGWQPGQLDMELKGQRPYKSENSWLTAEGNDSIIFNYDGEEQWKKAMDLSSVQMINQFF